MIVPAPPGEVTTWRMHDYDDKIISKGKIENGRIDLGQLPVGYYKIVRGAAGVFTNRTYIGVLEPLRAPTPRRSPIGIDVGMAWFWPSSKDKMQEVANLCQLAGMNRVRDRLLWGELEPERGKFVPHTRYDVSAQVQSEADLKILQVAHVSAQWANPNAKRFPLDLRDIYNFYREMAKRWKNEIEAFEPWNEADIDIFGGHAGSEMASLQKAAYLGLKAGNPNVTACMNVFAFHRPETLADFQDNKAWPYFDTYNLHHYEPLENYPKVYADHRAVSGGKPLWVSECSVRAKWTNEEFKELSEKNLRLQSERLTKTYALALYEGAQAIFYFVLPHYSEHVLQYGLLHPDLTPRPGFVALAAVGRLLADAKPRGRVKSNNELVQGYLFNAKPDGKESNVLVIWSEKETSFDLSIAPEISINHLGQRQKVTGKTLKLGSAPLYAILPRGIRFDLIPPPAPTKLLTDKPGKLVLQALVSEQEIAHEKSAYKISEGETKSIPVFLYNFGAKTLRGKMKTAAPKNWIVDFPKEAEIAPGERKELTLKVICPENANWADNRIQIQGSFGSDKKPVLVMRFTPTD